jgi:hypothetical protein
MRLILSLMRRINLKTYNKIYSTLSRGILQKLNNLVPGSEKIQIKKEQF